MSQSKRIPEKPREDRRTPADYEEEMWRGRLNTNKDGEVVIPPMAIKNMLQDAAKFCGQQIPGKGKSTYTKHFESGVLCIGDPEILVRDDADNAIKADSVSGETFFVPSNGVRGDGKRVDKTFPIIQPGWTAEVTVHVLDEIITPSVFEYHLNAAGRFVGLGRFRPQKGGFYGRFEAENLKWVDIDI